MDSAQLGAGNDEKLQRIVTFIQKHNIQIQKHNERPWGSYEVIFSNLNSNQWFMIPNCPWGFGFSILQGAAMTLQTVPNNEKHEEFFKLYFGQEKLDELKQIILES